MVLFLGGRYGALKESIKRELGKLTETGGGKVKGWANARVEVDHSRKILSKKAEKASSDIKIPLNVRKRLNQELLKSMKTYAGLSDQCNKSQKILLTRLAA